MMCDRYEDMISEFVDGELPDAETAGLFMHLGICERCRSSLSMMMHVRHSLTRLPQPSVRPELDARVLDIPRRFPRRKPKKLPSVDWIWKNRVHLPFPALATIVFVALFSSAVLLVSWLRPREAAEQATPRMIYFLGLEPVEVQGSYVHAMQRPQ